MTEPETTPSATPDDVDLGNVWLGIATEVWRRHPGRLERLVSRLLRSPGLARALLTTPSLLLPWLLATAGVLAAGALATAGTGQPLVGLLAPALAGAGITYAYGPGTDPAWELARSTAISDRMVLLVRALAVFAVNAAFGVLASAFCGQTVGLVFGWLVPMTAVCALALAAATLSHSANVGLAAGLTGWTISLLSSRVAEGSFVAAIDSSGSLVPYLACSACCVVVVLWATRTPKKGSPMRELS